MANLKALRDGGTWYPAARSLPVMETIPNHVMMMTGCRPARNGVPANSIYDRAEGALRDCSRGRPTSGDDDHRAAQRVGSYDGHGAVEGVPLLGLRRPGHPPLGAVPGHPGLRPRTRRRHDGRRARHGRRVRPGDDVRQPRRRRPGRPLGPDRHHPQGRPHGSARLDQRSRSAASSTCSRAAARGRRRWCIVLADHSMDWSLPEQTISLTSAFDADASLAGNFQIAQNGGADLVYWTGPASGPVGGAHQDEARWRSARPASSRPTSSTRRPRCGSARRPATCSSGARPAGGSATRVRRATRSRATTATRPPSRSRSSSAVGPPRSRRGSPARPRRTRWT